MTDELAFAPETRTFVTALRAHLAENDELWLSGLLTSGKLAQFAADMGLPLYGPETVTALWHVGLLRADLIQTEKPFRRRGLELIGRSRQNHYLYLDTRVLTRRARGFASSISGTRKLRSDIKIYFHPFRHYMLYRLVRTFSSRLSFTQFLVNDRRIAKVMNYQRSGLQQWTATVDFCHAIERWNDYTELAIALAPCSHVQIFQQLRWGPQDSETSIRQKLSSYQDRAKPAILGIGLKLLEKVRGELCIDAETIDGNKVLHILLRLCNATERGRLRGQIGGAMHVLAMAETIRRAAERAFGQKLKEEDELGFGQWMDGARKRLFGSERVLDASNTVARQFLQTMGIDFSVKIRCYLEGETEQGAFQSFTSDVDGIEYINLRGQFLEKGGNALAFAGALKNDMQSHVFSLVVLDGDNEEVTRVVRKAAADGNMFGWFYISKPDFEYANFTTEELTNVALELAADALNGASTPPPVTKTPVNAASGKAFFKAYYQAYPQLPKVDKGRAWGKALMEYAIRTHSKDKERQIITIARQIDWTTRLGYQDAANRYRVDPQSGQLVKKDPKSDN